MNSPHSPRLAGCVHTENSKKSLKNKDKRVSTSYKIQLDGGNNPESRESHKFAFIVYSKTDYSNPRECQNNIIPYFYEGKEKHEKGVSN